MSSKKSAIVERPSRKETKSSEQWVKEGLDRPTLNNEVSNSNALAQVKLRLKKDTLVEIDDLIKARRVKISRHLWLLEAIEEKIRKEQKGG